ncbi:MULTISPECIES: phosphatidate cytidylyltransferase [unclassified Variovorax]|uniref:phosphatidate cytidylyltransferase n=1 Tax=unclassified Variovorax TaxID=663243 RepID=UPI002575C182|nr:MULTISPECIES: phosphatidate cytidylyltransferase [unclassified Variovorax]MDM0086218.1 phosphatidate cytidylyltransferase [Variovorax sp. J22G40]MDM0145525.1 phosphatidate cytidylyltransferase [Variovorax sp. J2P1-31]
MLKQRILTALVLLAILLPAMFYPSHVPFACVMLVMIGAAAWEWGRLNGYGPRTSVFLGLEMVVLCALSWWLGLLEQRLLGVWLVASAAWVLGGAALLYGAVPGWPRIPRAVRLLGGLLALWVAWLAAVQARLWGINFLLSLLVLVWVADVFAYFAGRAFGLRFTRNKLAPSISPGKSWEGVWGGMIGVLVLALAWVWADASLQAEVPSLYSRLALRGAWMLLLGAVFLAAMSVVGDLVESLVKRSAGAKDSSNLLPGHGGVLDRIDALLPTLPIAMMLASLWS